LAYDLADLCLASIDLVVDRMGFESGISRTDLEAGLLEETLRFAPDAPKAERDNVVNVVIETLVRPMSAEYAGVDQRYRYDFQLLVELESPSGIYLRATTQAINFLVSALDTDVESAQAAAEAQLENLFKRRRLTEAEDIARIARIRSIQYGEEVRRIIADTRRDIRRAGWDSDVPARIKAMLNHLEERMQIETRMGSRMREIRDEAERDELRHQAARLVETVEDCHRRHLELHTRILEAERTFFQEHERQIFVRVKSLRAVDLTGTLLEPLLDSTLEKVTPFLDLFATRLWGIHTPRIGRYGALINQLLAAPLIQDPLGDLVPQPEWEDDALDPRRFPAPVIDVTEQLLRSLSQPQRLSELLLQARAVAGPLAADYLRLRSVSAIAPQLEQLRRLQPDPVLAAADDGTALHDPVYWGADLLVGWLELAENAAALVNGQGSDTKEQLHA
jgi:hypothetical protein